VHEDEDVHEHGHRHDRGGAHEHAHREPPCEDYDHHHIAHHAHHGRGHILNLRGAWLHLFGDALGSLAAVVAAIAIKLGASSKVDPLASFVVAAILVSGSARLLYEAVLVLLEASPPHLAVDRVRATIVGTDGVAELHELHVWTLGAGHDAISAHVSAKTADPALAGRVEGALRQRFQVEYVTIQVEVGGVTCQTDTVEP
jgi:cation diffusion facilitator family transporter